MIAVEGRPAIEDQLKRLRRATEDPALMIGTSKEMLESTAKYVLEAFSVPTRLLLTSTSCGSTRVIDWACTRRMWTSVC